MLCASEITPLQIPPSPTVGPARYHPPVDHIEMALRCVVRQYSVQNSASFLTSFSRNTSTASAQHHTAASVRMNLKTMGLPSLYASWLCLICCLVHTSKFYLFPLISYRFDCLLIRTEAVLIFILIFVMETFYQ